MDILVLNTNLEAVAAVDTFESLLWTDRYCEYGEFEIYTLATPELLSWLQQDYYLWLKESNHQMIIEGIQIKSDVELGNRLVVTGRSLESILDRRIIWGQTILTGNLQDGIEKLLNENIISPTVTERAISNFIFEASVDPLITVLTVDAQFTWTNLYDSIKALCVANNIGFQVTLEDDQFVFKLYAGVDRSYDQFVNPYVIFSPQYENLINSNYTENKALLKTVDLVAGEGEGSDRITTVIGAAVSDLNRRELYTDARDLSQTVDGILMLEADYILQLTQRGAEDLADHIFTQNFDGQIDSKVMYKFGESFFIGDIVQIANEYGMEAKSRVTEIIYSQNISSVDVYPTFTMIE